MILAFISILIRLGVRPQHRIGAMLPTAAFNNPRTLPPGSGVRVTSSTSKARTCLSIAARNVLPVRPEEDLLSAQGAGDRVDGRQCARRVDHPPQRAAAQRAQATRAIERDHPFRIVHLGMREHSFGTDIGYRCIPAVRGCLGGGGCRGPPHRR